jgi:SAM-dependent methyltransferase
MKKCLNCLSSYQSDAWLCPKCGMKPLQVGHFYSFSPKLSSDSGFKDSYFHELSLLESGNFWFAARNTLIIWAIRNFLPNSDNFMEIGCGTGFVLSSIKSAYPQLKLAGSEISSEGLFYALARVPNSELIQMDARSIPYNNEFCAIGAFDVLEHIYEDGLVLRQINQALRNGGTLLLTVPQHKFLWSQMDDYSCHVRRYSRSELVEKVSMAGFKVERVTSFVSLLLPLMLVSRLNQHRRKSYKSYDALAELRIGWILNLIFKSVMAIEFFLIKSGLNFPIGGSLFLVAKKVNE